MNKYTISIVIMMLGNSYAFSQENQAYKNAVKFNVAGPLVSVYSAQVEKSVSKNVSFLFTGFYREKKNLPFATEFDRFAKSRGVGLTGVDFEYIFLDQAKMGFKGVAPELRFYIGKKKNRPFVGIFGQYTDYDMTVPASFLVDYRGQELELVAPIDFKIETISGGVLIGQQFRFGRFGLDVVLVGPHMGRANSVNAEINQDLLGELSEFERAYFRARVIQRFRIDEKYYNTEVSDTQGTVNSTRKVPFIGIRGAGLNLSYYF